MSEAVDFNWIVGSLFHEGIIPFCVPPGAH